MEVDDELVAVVVVDDVNVAAWELIGPVQVLLPKPGEVSGCRGPA